MNGDYCEHGDSLANREVSDIFERLLVQLHRPFHLSYNWYYESTRYISFLVITLLQPHKTQTQNNINVGSHKSFRELVTRHVVHLPLLPSRHVFIVYARRVAAENRVTLRHPQLQQLPMVVQREHLHLLPPRAQNRVLWVRAKLAGVQERLPQLP